MGLEVKDVVVTLWLAVGKTVTWAGSFSVLSLKVPPPGSLGSSESIRPVYLPLELQGSLGFGACVGYGHSK